MSAIYVNSIKDKTNTRELASDSGSAWSWGSGLPKGSVIEQFASQCDGSSITVQSGTYTVANVTGVQNLDSTFTTITGSNITYTPPSGTQTVIYQFQFIVRPDDSNSIAHYKLFIGGTEVTDQGFTTGAELYLATTVSFSHAFHIGGSTNNATGRQATWTSGKEILMKAREFGSGNEAKLHQTNTFDGTGTERFNRPFISITALA